MKPILVMVFCILFKDTNMNLQKYIAMYANIGKDQKLSSEEWLEVMQKNTQYELSMQGIGSLKKVVA